MRPKCIVCGRLISPRTETHWVRRIGQQYPASAPIMGNFQTKTEVQRLVTHPVVMLRYDIEGYVNRFSTWDGETYKSSYFCCNTCAARQGYASARNGDRYTWT